MLWTLISTRGLLRGGTTARETALGAGDGMTGARAIEEISLYKHLSRKCFK
jgi:hypothetical protein